MVKLGYCFRIKAPFQEVWNYFSRFENIVNYDPCVKQAVVLNEQVKQLGRKIDITTIHHGKEAKMVYQVIKYSEQLNDSLRNNSIIVKGLNEKISSVDEIVVREISKNKDEFNVILQYNADLCLRGFYWIGTVFALSTFKQIAVNAQEGCRKRCIVNWGENNVHKILKSQL